MTHPMTWAHLEPDDSHEPRPLEELVGGKRLCETCLEELATDAEGKPTTPDQHTQNGEFAGPSE